MKFGAFVPQGWRLDLVGVPVAEQWPTMLAAARRIERLGYDTAWVYDHFHTVPQPVQEATYECWTLMAALAATTERIRLGQMCTCNSYRSPAYLAKVASNVDVISGGRQVRAAHRCIQRLPTRGDLNTGWRRTNGSVSRSLRASGRPIHVSNSRDPRFWFG